MTPSERQRFDFVYKQHLTNLTLQGKRPATIDGYSRAVRRIADYFDRCPDNLCLQEMKQYFTALIGTHSWSTVKIDRNGLQFFYKHTLTNNGSGSILLSRLKFDDCLIFFVLLT